MVLKGFQGGSCAISPEREDVATRQDCQSFPCVVQSAQLNIDIVCDAVERDLGLMYL